MRTAGQNRRRPSERTVTVYSVMVDAPGSEFGDRCYRFRTRREASAFAAGKIHWGRPSLVTEDTEVPYRLALRWGCA